MKAKWLWTTWAYLTTAAVVVMELLFCWFAVTLAIPKMQGLRAAGMLRLYGEPGDEAITRMFSFLHGLQWTWNTLACWIILVLAALWGLFEWRVRGENKPLMRLAALGTAALGMTVVVVITAGSIELPIFRQLPAMDRMSTSAAIRRMATIDASVAALDEAMDKKDWDAAQENADRATKAIKSLSAAAGWFNETTPPDEQSTVDQFRARLNSANESLAAAQEAIRDKDTERLKTAMQNFREQYGPVGKRAR